jgi:hypothetical protein
MVSAAAPIAPIAAPAAAPVTISLAASMTLSTMLDDRDPREVDERPRRGDDEDEPLFFEPLELLLLAIDFPPKCS